ncbi:hypothetical protein SAMN03159341_101807 [Paenibacillus sp. 1_12]|uniref:hypothetical protein n=1 Tax=Paenibacillus sp. 1_12 TaxID=1566278 RepID=UPI0008E84527|nr:hypothetical protein [Paenibacillus sp. 1_12]SFK83530.1 hypothetical protein SAMN03159341_101807 [Paenibacillus sp. 1_12]
MRNLTIGTYLLLIMLILSACTHVEAPQTQKGTAASSNKLEQVDTRAQLLKVYTDLTEESGWSVAPKGVGTMTIYAEAENTETVLFWLVPTGTETWSERILIGYDKDGSDGWSLVWEFGNRSLHDHIYVQALGSDSSTQAAETINVHSL